MDNLPEHYMLNREQDPKFVSLSTFQSLQNSLQSNDNGTLPNSLKFDPSSIPDTSYSHLPMPEDNYENYFDLNLEDFEMNDEDILIQLDSLDIPAIPTETQLISKTEPGLEKAGQGKHVLPRHQRQLSGTAIFGFHNHNNTLLPEAAPSTSQLAENDEIVKQQNQLKQALEQQRQVNMKLEAELKFNQLQQEKLQNELMKQKQIMTSPNRQATNDGQIFITSNSPQGMYKFPPQLSSYQSPERDICYSNNSSPIRPLRDHNHETLEMQVAQTSSSTTLDGSPVRKPALMLNYQKQQQQPQLSSIYAQELQISKSLYMHPNIPQQPYKCDSNYLSNRAMKCHENQVEEVVPKDNVRIKSSSSNVTSHSTILQPTTPSISNATPSLNKSNNTNPRNDFANSNGSSSVGLGLMMFMMDDQQISKSNSVPSKHDSDQTEHTHSRISLSGSDGEASKGEFWQNVVLKPPALHVKGDFDASFKKGQLNEPESRFTQAQTPSPILKTQEKFEGACAVNFEIPKKSPIKRASVSSAIGKKKNMYLTPKLQSTSIFGSSDGHEKSGLGAAKNASNNFAQSPIIGPPLSPMTKYVSIPSPVVNVHGEVHNNGTISPSTSRSNSGDPVLQDSPESKGTTIGIINMSPKRIRKSSTLPPGTIDQYVIELPDKTFVCNFQQCWKKFHRRYNIRAHIQTHLQDKPHKCDFEGCDKAFVRNHDLQRHKKSHVAKMLQCECGKKYGREDALIIHQAKKSCVKKLTQEKKEKNGSEGSSNKKKEDGLNKSPNKKVKKPETKFINDSSSLTSQQLTNTDLAKSSSKFFSTSNHNKSPVKINIARDIAKNGKQNMVERVETLLTTQKIANVHDSQLNLQQNRQVEEVNPNNNILKSPLYR